MFWALGRIFSAVCQLTPTNVYGRRLATNDDRQPTLTVLVARDFGQRRDQECLFNISDGSDLCLAVKAVHKGYYPEIKQTISVRGALQHD